MSVMFTEPRTSDKLGSGQAVEPPPPDYYDRWTLDPPPPDDSGASGRDDEDRTIEIHLIRGESADGVWVYAHVAIFACDVAEMNLALVTRDSADLEEFGVIVACGEGSEPDPETKAYIQEMYLEG